MAIYNPIQSELGPAAMYSGLGRRALLVAIAFVFLVVLLMVGAFLSFRSVIATRESRKSVEHTHQVIDALDNVLIDLVNAETGRRGYALTKNEDLLNVYRSGMKALEGDLSAIKRLTADNPNQQGYYTTLEPLVHQRTRLLEETVERVHTRAFDDNLDKTLVLRGHELMNQIRSLISTMQREEKQLLATRQSNEDRNSQKSAVTILVSTFVLLLMLVVTGGIMFREMSRPTGFRPNLEKRLLDKAWPGFAVAVVGTALAALLRSGLGYMVGEELPPYITFYPVIIFSAIIGGTRAGLFSTALGTLTVWVLFLSPIGSLKIGGGPSAIVGLALFCAINIAVSLICGALRDARRRSITESSLLRQSEQRLRGTFDNAAVGIVEVDETERILTVNDRACNILGYNQQEMLGKTVHELTYPEDRALTMHVNTEVREGRRLVADYEKRYLKRDGSPLWVHVTISSLRDSQGRHMGAIGTIEDISVRQQAEEKLRESEARFRELADMVPMLIWQCGPERACDYFNKRWLEFTGRTFEQEMGKGWTEGLHPEDAERVLALFHDATERREFFEMEYRLRHHSGEYRWILDRGRPRISSDGTFLGYIGGCIDINYRKQAEMELLALREKLAAELAAMNRLHELSTRFLRQEDLPTLMGGILEAAIDTVGAQRGHVHLVDRSSGELPIIVQRGLDQAFLNYFSHTKPGQIGCGMAIETTQCVVVEDVAKSPLFLADSEALELKLARQIRAMICTPLVTHAGESVGVISVDFAQPHRPSDRDLRLLDILARQAADFIERKQAETRLARQTHLEQFRADVAQTLQSAAETPVLLQQVSGIIAERLEAAFARIWTLDSTGSTLLLQASAGQYTHLNGPHSRIAVGQFKIGRIAQERRPHLSNRVIGDPQVHDQEWAKREDLVAFAGYPLLIGDRLLGVMALFARHELSPEVHHSLGAVANLLAQALARQQAEEALRKTKDELARANQDLDRQVQERTAKLQETVDELEHFSYTITHDMRAPLRAMQGFGHLLLGQCEDCFQPQRREFLRRIAESAGRMDSLITDALNYTKIVRKEFPLEPVNTDKLLRSMLESYPQFQSPKAEISIEGPLPIVLGNEAAMTQSFSNLLGNAVKFVQQGKVPKVRVWAENRGDYVRLWFEDNGIGIAERHQEQIFVMFQRLSKDYEGTGIGLALVSKAVERMQGHVGVESEEGQGSRFWIELKSCESETPTYEREAAAVHRG